MFQQSYGGTFFAIPYLGLSVGALPSIIIGAAAYGAGELILHKKNKDDILSGNPSLYDTLVDAKEKNRQILAMAPQIEDDTLKKNIKEISETITKIISAVEKNPGKLKNMNNFFQYYLPVTLNILNKYDEIENQNLTTEESKKFMAQTQDMIQKINHAFRNQLANLYQAEIVDTDAEMRVFDSMLKADGYDTSSDFESKKKKEENSGGK